MRLGLRALRFPVFFKFFLTSAFVLFIISLKFIFHVLHTSWED